MLFTMTDCAADAKQDPTCSFRVFISFTNTECYLGMTQQTICLSTLKAARRQTMTNIRSHLMFHMYSRVCSTTFCTGTLHGWALQSITTQLHQVTWKSSTQLYKKIWLSRALLKADENRDKLISTLVSVLGSKLTQNLCEYKYLNF